jgi:hypothetical protein
MAATLIDSPAGRKSQQRKAAIRDAHNSTAVLRSYAGIPIRKTPSSP